MIAGRRSDSSWAFPMDILFISGFPVIGLALAVERLLSLQGFAWITAFALSMVLALLGAGLIYRAKRPLYRKGRYFTFGPKAIPAAWRRTYLAGMGLVIVGCGFGVLLLLASGLWR